MSKKQGLEEYLLWLQILPQPEVNILYVKDFPILRKYALILERTLKPEKIYTIIEGLTKEVDGICFTDIHRLEDWDKAFDDEGFAYICKPRAFYFSPYSSDSPPSKEKRMLTFYMELKKRRLLGY